MGNGQGIGFYSQWEGSPGGRGGSHSDSRVRRLRQESRQEWMGPEPECCLQWGKEDMADMLWSPLEFLQKVLGAQHVKNIEVTSKVWPEHSLWWPLGSTIVPFAVDESYFCPWRSFWGMPLFTVYSHPRTPPPFLSSGQITLWHMTQTKLILFSLNLILLEL